MDRSRRLLLPLWMSAREGIAALVGERDALAAELAEAVRHERAVLEELRELRAEMDDLRELLNVRRARERTEAELRELYRERDLQRASSAQRDPSRLLH